MKKWFLSALLLLSGLWAQAQNTDSVELQTIDGGVTTPAEWVDGKTPFVVSFWHVTCRYCIEEMDTISEVFEDWSAEAPFRFIGICTNDSRSLAKAKALVRSRDWGKYTFYFDVNQEYARAMKVTQCPHLFLFDKNGKLVYSHLGYTPGDEEILFEKIKALN